MTENNTQTMNGLKYNKDGSLDMRCRANKKVIKERYEAEIARLSIELEHCKTLNENLSQRVKFQHAAIEKLSPDNHEEIDPDELVCAICMDNMQGKVTLKCGHELCPECFAQHSRQNNTCPFCRDEFASKVKKRDIMPDTVMDSILERTFAPPTPVDYFERHLQIIESQTSQLQKITQLTWLVKANCHLLMKNTRRWYEHI